jgi:hypothetical protein
MMLRAAIAFYTQAMCDSEREPTDPEIETLRRDQSITVANTAIDLVELGRFLHALCLSEYQLDSVAHEPAPLRERTVESLAEQVGWPREKLRAADGWWRRSGRRLVLGRNA